MFRYQVAENHAHRLEISSAASHESILGRSVI